MAQEEVSTYNAQIFDSSMKMSTDIERSKDVYDPAASEFIVFSFEDQIPHVKDYIWERKFPVEIKKNKRVDVSKLLFSETEQ